MRLLSAADDGTTVVELTDREAHALRNVLTGLPGSPAAYELQRLLATVHGEAHTVHAHGGRCLDPQCGPCSFDRAIPKETQR